MKKRPEICLLLYCKTVEELKKEIDEYGPYCQMVEWYADEFENIDNYTKEEFYQLVRLVKSFCKGKPLSIGMNCGGEKANNYLTYAMGAADYINLSYDNKNIEKMVKEAHKRRTKAIVSYYEMEKILSKEEISTHLLKLEKTGADLLSIAAFANKEEDAYALLEGAYAYNQLNGHRPFAAIAMGDEGQASRICCGDFGSKMTFACGSKVNAPGQFNAKDLKRYMDVYYG